MRAYLAAKYARRDELRGYIPQLNEAGIEVTSRWLQETAALDGNMGDHSELFYMETAVVDIDDIDSADFVIFFSEDPLVGVPRGGRHVEFGYAVGTNKSIAVIGPKENVFHYLPRTYANLIHFENLEELVESYKKHHPVTVGE